MKYHDDALLDHLAAEYVLGTLHGRARARFQRLLDQRPELRDRVASWEQRLNKMAVLAAPVEPPDATWRQLEQRLFAPPRRQRWYEKLTFWQSLSAGSGLLAASLAVLLWFSPLQPVADYIVVLAGKDLQPVWTLSTSDAMDRLQVNNTMPMPMPKDKGCILWLHPEGSEQYYRLGKIPDDGGQGELAVAPELRKMLLQGRLMVTIENIARGMPPAPAAPVLYAGKLAPMTSS